LLSPASPFDNRMCACAPPCVVAPQHCMRGLGMTVTNYCWHYSSNYYRLPLSRCIHLHPPSVHACLRVLRHVRSHHCIAWGLLVRLLPIIVGTDRLALLPQQKLTPACSLNLCMCVVSKMRLHHLISFVLLFWLCLTIFVMMIRLTINGLARRCYRLLRLRLSACVCICSAMCSRATAFA
jgi:hypothetical protein